MLAVLIELQQYFITAIDMFKLELTNVYFVKFLFYKYICLMYA